MAVSGPFMPNRSPTRLVVTGLICLVGGVALANAPRLFPQFDDPLIDSAALIAGVLVGIAGGLTLLISIVIIAANARR